MYQYADNSNLHQLHLVSLNMADIDYKQMAGHIRKQSKALKTATRNTLNDVAFMAQGDVTDQATRDVKFRKSPKRALGLRVKKATYSNMESALETNRGWLYYHLNKGMRNSTNGLTFKGQSYIVVPANDKAFTKTKKLKKAYSRRAYIVPDGSDALMFYRPRRGPSVLIASLKRRVKHNEDTKPEDTIKKVVQGKGLAKLQDELNKSIERGR